MSENSGYAFWEDVKAQIAANAKVRHANGKPTQDSFVADESIRINVLIEAGDLIDGDRNNQYGPPSADFERTAALWSAMGFRVNGENVRGHQVAMAMACLKLSRLAWNPGKRDSWVDLAGYAACGFEAHEESK